VLDIECNSATLKWGVPGALSANGSFSYPEPFLRAVRRGALGKSITGYHKKHGNRIYPVLEQQPSLWPIRCQFDMDLARAPCRAPLTARKMGSGYENANGLKKTVEYSFVNPKRNLHVFSPFTH
jgi:hypothetical protein